MDFVASYPKSGNTWIRLTTAAFVSDGAGPEELMHYDTEDQTAQTSIRFSDNERYCYQTVSPFPLNVLDFAETMRLRPAALLVLSREISTSASPEPTLVKSHNIHGEVNEIPLWHSEWTDRVINPVRDPREICCSYSAHTGWSYCETAEFMARRMARSEAEDHSNRLDSLLSTWSNHVRSWLSVSDLPVHTVRYEDLQANAIGEFYDIFKFLDIPNLDVEEVEEAVAKTRFDKVRAAEDKHGFVESTENQEQFFRSGETDGWKEELPVDVARKIEKDHGEMMEQLGYL